MSTLQNQNDQSLSNNPNLKLFIQYGMISELLLLLYKPFQAKFLERIGGDELSISLLNSLPGLVMVFTVLPAILIMRNYNSQKTTAVTLVITRSIVFLCAFIPFLDTKWQPMAFILLIALMSGPMSIYTNGFQTLTGELFTPVQRAYALGLKSKYSVLITMLVTFTTGQILSKLPSTANQRLLIYQSFFVLAFVFTVFELNILRKFKPIEQTQNSNKPFKLILKNIFSNKPYLLFVSCSLVFHFGWQMGWPLFSIYTIKTLGADEGWLSIISIASMITLFIGYSQWPKLISKFGNPVIVAICAMGMSLTPLLYIVSKDLYTLTFMASLTGIFTSGTLTVLLSSILEVIPKKNRILYMGVYTTFTNVTLAIAPIIGHYFLSTYSIQFALFMTTLFRMLGGFTFIARNIFIKKQRLNN